AVPLGLAAEVEVLLRYSCASFAVEPRFGAQERTVAQHRLGIERAAVARQGQALLEQEHPPSLLRQLKSGCRSAGSRSNDDNVVVHRDCSCCSSGQRCTSSTACSSGSVTITEATRGVPVTGTGRGETK